MEENEQIEIDKVFKFVFKHLFAILLTIFIIAFIFSGVFTIDPEEVGVILRFGKYSRNVSPGLNFKLPFIEDVIKVPVQRQLKAEFGFRTLKAGIKTMYSRNNYDFESLMLTGDLNAAKVEWIVQYRISNPYKYLFKVRNAEQTFRDMNEAVMRQIIGDKTINEVLTTGKQEIANLATIKLQKMADQYETGIKVAQVVLQDVNPPDKVKSSFNEVNEAQQEKEKLINEAKSEYNKVIPKAKGDALKIIEEAKGYALERINKAKGDADNFIAVYKEYVKSKSVTKQRIYLETMQKVLKKIDKKIISDKNLSGILPLFQTDKINQGAVK